MLLMACQKNLLISVMDDWFTTLGTDSWLQDMLYGWFYVYTNMQSSQKYVKNEII